MKSASLSSKFCRCVKKVAKTIKLRKGQKKTASAKESAAIAVCTTSILHTRGRTLKKFSCKKGAKLQTQKPISRH
jgi:hypothetical protein